MLQPSEQSAERGFRRGPFDDSASTARSGTGQRRAVAPFPFVEADEVLAVTVLGPI